MKRVVRKELYGVKGEFLFMRSKRDKDIALIGVVQSAEQGQIDFERLVWLEKRHGWEESVTMELGSHSNDWCWNDDTMYEFFLLTEAEALVYVL